MGSLSDTPSLVAGGDIYPCRGVKLSASADNTGLQATAVTEPIVGVTADSTRRFDDTKHAVSGEPISLQGGQVVIVEAAGNITRGALVEFDTDGKIITLTTTTGVAYFALQALESASAGAKVRCVWVRGRDKLS
jgi:hypothetical protein